jgi:hypothetical protein
MAVSAPVALGLADQVGHVAALAVLLDDEQAGGRLVDDAVVVTDDEGVAQLTQDVHLRRIRATWVGGWGVRVTAIDA